MQNMIVEVSKTDKIGNTGKHKAKILKITERGTAVVLYVEGCFKNSFEDVPLRTIKLIETENQENKKC